MGAPTRPSGNPFMFDEQPLIDIPSELEANIEKVLTNTVKANGLECFYDATTIHTMARSLAITVDYDGVCKRAKSITRSMAIDLSALALYDIVFLCDNSASVLQFPERKDDLSAMLAETVEVMAQFSASGVSVSFLNSTLCAENVRTAADATDLLDRVSYCGLTQLGTMFRKKIINKYLGNSMKKPVLAFIITDGEPQGEDSCTLLNVIQEARRMFGNGRLAVQIAQVGTDPAAQAFLKALDNNTCVGDMIDCTSNYELEAEEWKKKGHGTELTAFLYFMKLWLGAINREYDTLG